jgi:hypothetical protein
MIDLDSMFCCNSECPWIRNVADVIVGCSARVDIKEMRQVSACHLVLKDRLSKWRPADIPETNKEYFLFIHRLKNMTKLPSWHAISWKNPDKIRV